MNEISIHKILSVLEFNPDKKSPFKWKIFRNGNAKQGEPAGCVQTHKRTGKKYRRIKIDNKLYLEHRLVWFLVFGYFPNKGTDIDHINGDGLDNRPSNLRLASRSENLKNTKLKRNNKSGCTGVYFDKIYEKWVAEIRVDKRIVRLGRFSRKEDAIAKRKRAEKEIYKEFSYEESQKINP